MILYKYYKVSENTLKALTLQSLWCHHPNRMNDPFECLELLTRKFSDTELSAFRIEISKRRSLQSWISENLDNVQLSEAINRHRKACIQKFAFCALSENPFDILMWSHYADSHRGFCLGFEFDDLQNPAIFQKVQYRDQLLDYDLNAFAKFMGGDDSLLANLMSDISIKAHVWEREAEWRIWRNQPMYYSYKPHEIKEINFGINCSKETKAMLIKLINTESDPDMYDIEISQHPFCLTR
jgi:hypothetical protein